MLSYLKLLLMNLLRRPPYAHVFRSGQPKCRWPKLDNSEPLSKLHAKYWGKNIDNEVGGEPMDIGGRRQGGFVLDLDIDSLETSKIWVRKDYTRIYEFCDKHSAEVQNDNFEQAASIVITGQPGVGECFSSYIHSSIPCIFGLKGRAIGFYMPYADA